MFIHKTQSLAYTCIVLCTLAVLFIGLAVSSGHRCDPNTRRRLTRKVCTLQKGENIAVLMDKKTDKWVKARVKSNTMDRNNIGTIEAILISHCKKCGATAHHAKAEKCSKCGTNGDWIVPAGKNETITKAKRIRLHEKVSKGARTGTRSAIKSRGKKTLKWTKKDDFCVPTNTKTVGGYPITKPTGIYSRGGAKMTSIDYLKFIHKYHPVKPIHKKEKYHTEKMQINASGQLELSQENTNWKEGDWYYNADFEGGQYVLFHIMPCFDQKNGKLGKNKKVWAVSKNENFMPHKIVEGFEPNEL